jgi:hypothetical protein
LKLLVAQTLRIHDHRQRITVKRQRGKDINLLKRDFHDYSFLNRAFPRPGFAFIA